VPAQCPEKGDPVPKPPRVLGLLFCLSLLCALSATISSAALHAQSGAHAATPVQHDVSTDNADDSGDDQPALLVANVSFVDSGKLTVYANVFEPNRETAGASELKAALQEALGCSLADQAHFRARSDSYAGSCTVPRPASRFLRQGKISTAALRRFCQQRGIETINLSLGFPDAEIIEVVPRAPAPGGDTYPGNVRLRRYRRLFSNYTWTLGKPFPDAIEYRFGYSLSRVQRSAIFLFLILLAPLAFLYWLGRKALSADIPDKAVVWFSYMRCLSWTLSGSLLFWWTAVDFFKVNAISQFLSVGTRFAPFLAHPVAAQIVGWVPPSIVWLLCFRLSHPVQEKLRGLHWTKRELTLQALYSVLGGLIPLAMFFTGISLIISNTTSAAIWFTAAVVVRLFAARALLKLTGMQPHALTSGDLRDRAFALATHLGVKLQQVYLIPSGKGQMANAFATSANSISFTDFLLQRMSKPEVDYVMAHELTHLKLQHPSKLGMARIGGLILGLILVGGGIAFLPWFDFKLFEYFIVFGMAMVFPFFISRRFEYAADAGSVAVTGDPRAAISALFKLAQLNMHPLQWSKWSEKWLSHPSCLRRAQAIARKAGIPVEEIPGIAREGASAASTYSPRSITAPSDKLYSTQYKKASIRKASYVLLAILSFVPCFCALAARHVSEYPAFRLSLFIASIPATFGAVLLLSNYVPRLTRANLPARLDRKLSSQGIQVRSWSGTYVGLAPAAAPRTYEGSSFWDIGYLFLRSDRICYWGEEAQFALRRDQITDIKCDVGLPGFLGVKRVYIAWRDNDKSSCGVFNLGWGHADSLRSGSQRTKELAERLRLWWKTPSSGRPLPAPLDTLSSPTTRNVTCTVPGALWRPRKIFNELFATSWIAALAAMLCGLPFHLVGYLTASSLRSTGIPNSYSSPGAGWFVVLAAALVRFLSLIPTLLYRDRPILVAQPPAGIQAFAAPSLDPSPSTSSPRDPVPVS
jgi:Zn-dependent protease with chaperone function